MLFFFQNYGDESDAYGLINPSIYSNLGVYEKDFFQPRDQYEVIKASFKWISWTMLFITKGAFDWLYYGIRNTQKF